MYAKRTGAQRCVVAVYDRSISHMLLAMCNPAAPLSQGGNISQVCAEVGCQVLLNGTLVDPIVDSASDVGASSQSYQVLQRFAVVVAAIACMHCTLAC